MNTQDINTPFTLTAVSHIAARTSTVTTDAVDVRSYKGGLAIVQSVGTVGGATRTLDGAIETSANGSTGWTAITGATFAQVSAADNVQKIGLDVRQTLGYIRYVGTIAGTSTPSLTMGVVMLGQKERV
jgi:hypothetical protein